MVSPPFLFRSQSQGRAIRGGCRFCHRNGATAECDISSVGPLIDFSLTFRRWYQIGLLSCTASLAVIGAMPLGRNTVWALTALVFLSELGANLIVFSVGGMIAVVVDDRQKGRAAGWFQAAWLGGAALSGGGGVWLAANFSTPVAGILLSAISGACALALQFLPAVSVVGRDQFLKQRLRNFGHELLELLRSPEGLYVTILDLLPIGVGAVTNLWAAICSRMGGFGQCHRIRDRCRERTSRGIRISRKRLDRGSSRPLHCIFWVGAHSSRCSDLTTEGSSLAIHVRIRYPALRDITGWKLRCVLRVSLSRCR